MLNTGLDSDRHYQLLHESGCMNIRSKIPSILM